MWEDDYIASLTLLPGTLAELGATAKPEGASLEEEDQNQWDLHSVMDAIDSTLSTLVSLEDAGVFFFLGSLSGFEPEMRSVLAAAPGWGAAQVVAQVERSLRPLQDMVSRFAPKAYGILLEMKDFLEEIWDYDWGAKDWLEHLTVLLEYLGELQPGGCLNYLKSLHLTLTVHRGRLVWLAVHPLVEKHLGRRNLFGRLSVLRINLEGAQTFLMELQGKLEKLCCLQAVDLNG